MTAGGMLAADLLGFEDDLTEPERQTLLALRAYLESEVRPQVNGLWERAEFPAEIIGPLAELGVYSFGGDHAAFENSAVFRGFVTLELARVDSSLATFAGVHTGLASGSIALCGSVEQQAEWLPRMATGEVIGSFALTEPESGSDVARGLRTTARRDGDHWVLNGEKRWIGNATWGDVVVVWARDEADDQVKGFIVPTSTPGYRADKIEGKYSLRIVQNAHITLTDVRVPDSWHLAEANSFADTNRVLQATRLDVAWSAVGNAIGAYEHALAYARARTQFGKPIASFQLVQDLLVKSLGNITASLAMVVRVAALNDRGVSSDEHSAMAKLYATSRTREAVAWCREILGGNGIVIDYDVIRHFADAEAQYSFEGTREVNTLILGRAITGMQAFV
ncbi:glutaryl-CoA dehydrogenase [Microbacterium thalassium]|uniref:Glutaryl-CoA dehydrogenase n=2 Tax=Microbacterium thalassium TaxID=362649 RepID=A0A7X0FTR9_9MICO|nr:glutaryl-CoA dehydrogenase [Microbacterium thalassium]GLK22729.1 glutaryl-CoA dehydrogenase [Microbacterium thalassium]